MYKVVNSVYIGTRQIPVKNQRGKLYVNYRGRQVNLNDISVLPQEKADDDPVFNYIFCGGFINYRCFAMDYWIERHRMKKRITTKEFKQIHTKMGAGNPSVSFAADGRNATCIAHLSFSCT